MSSNNIIPESQLLERRSLEHPEHFYSLYELYSEQKNSPRTSYPNPKVEAFLRSSTLYESLSQTNLLRVTKFEQSHVSPVGYATALTEQV